MEIAEKSEMINFYGNFLASISPIPLSEFKTILGNFVSDELPYF